MVKNRHDRETLARGLQVIVTCALIHHNFDGIEKVFLPKRADTKKFMPSVYELPGGHVDFGENITAGLKREIREEFDKEIILGDPFAIFTYTNEIKGTHSIETVYFAQFAGGIDDIKIHPEDHAGYQWLSEVELQKMLQGTSKDESDAEYQIIQRAFRLLRGDSLNFGA